MTDNGKPTFLTVRDLGPIVRADVELRPVTVFVGPSNTGKSFLSILLYALRKAHDDRWSVSNAATWNRRFRERASKGVRRKTTAWANGLSELDSLVEVPVDIKDAVAPIAQLEHADQVAGELARCFGVSDLRRLVRRSANTCAFGLSSVPDTPEPFRFRISRAGRYSLDPATIGSAIGRFQTTGLRVNSRSLHGEVDEAISRLVEVARMLICAEIASAIGPPASSVHYLPADRTGIMHAHRAVVSSLIRSASRGGPLSEAPLPELSGVVADFLQRLIGMREGASPMRSANAATDRGVHDARRLSDLLGRLQKDILDGSIAITQSETGYPSFSYRPTGWNDALPLANASSMVSELAPVVLFLRHVVGPGDTLIVEEPEAHLHPAKQVEFTHCLAAVAKAGVRVVITTHSEWVLEALANLVRMSALPKTDRGGLPGNEFALDPDEVGAWMFQPRKRPKGSVVTEVPLNLESATFPAGFGEVTASLYNDWARISNRVEQGKQQ